MTLGETCHITDGAHAKVERVKNGILYLTSKNIGQGNLILDRIDYITKEDFDRLFPINSKAQRRLVNGDILIGIIGTFGNAYRYKSSDTFGISSSVAILRPNHEILDSDYLYYVVTSDSFKNVHSAYKSGSAQGYTNIPTLKQLPIPVLPLPEQKAIAHILGSLDDKIELNRQMNQTLEQMAQALFKSWFVNFDPVIDNALAAGNIIPEPLQKRAEQRRLLSQSKQGDARKPLPEDIQNLFPAEFEFSEELDKWVPMGWRVCTINDVADVIGGGTPSTKVEEYFCEDGIAWLSPKDLSGYEWKFISKGAKDITDLGLAKSSAKLMPKGTVLFSSRAPIGYVAIAENEISTNQGFKSLVPKPGMCSEFLYYFLKTNVENIEAIATGSTFKEVSGNALKSFYILIPPTDILETYKTNTDDYNSKRLINQKEVQSLTKLRDALLPKLVSGEVRLSAEAMAQAGVPEEMMPKVGMLK
ncbi:restriction endonuclease subunit S [Draconibacterium orientale]|uniref:restriction endonuclease subunit S n=1 Tax=Draconibacterium orientale TaxID=1168034 RepID=UPI002A0A4177|nr:restriction endonuclease subunit S [Draconibacterium orientale]